MKRSAAFLLALSMLFTAACSAAPSGAASAPAGSSEAPAEAAATEETADAAAEAEETADAAGEEAQDLEDMPLVMVNTDGLGEIAVSETEEMPEFDEEYPFTSSFTHVKKGTTIALRARGQDDFQFVRWTKDGENYSFEPDITATIDEDTEFIAVFAMAGSYDGPAVEDIADAKTMADVLALPNYASSMTEKYYAYVFELKGVLYRAVSFISEDVASSIFELDFEDPDYDEKYNAIIAPLPIDQLDNMDDLIPSQEELDAYIGKTGGDLLDEGWTYSWYNLEDMEFGMEHGMFSYTVAFDGTLSTGGEVEDEMIRPLKVLSVTYDSLADPAADLEEKFFSE